MKNRIAILTSILISLLIFIPIAYSTLYYFQGYDNEQLSVDTFAVVQFTQSKLNNGGNSKTDRAYCTVEDNAIRYWYAEGTAGAPTSTNGIDVPADTPFKVLGYENINSFRMIAQSGTATINIQYETLRTLK